MRAMNAPSPIEWETVSCPLCGAASAVELLRTTDPLAEGAGPEFRVVRCAACSLVYTNPRPAPASMAAFYPPDYAPHRQIGLTPAAARRAERWSRAPAWLRWRAPHKRGLPPWGQGRLLDVGCGGGAFLHRMRIQGWQATGLDASPALAARVGEALNLRVLGGTLPHPALGAGCFDLVTLWASLEHMHDPLEALAAVHRLLDRGGRVIVAVHNIASALFGLFGSSWFCLDPPRHLIHFSPHTLRRALEQTEFHVEGLYTTAKPDWLRASLQLAERRNQRSVWLRAVGCRPVGRAVSSLLACVGRSDGLWARARKI